MASFSNLCTYWCWRRIFYITARNFWPYSTYKCSLQKSWPLLFGTSYKRHSEACHWSFCVSVWSADRHQTTQPLKTKRIVVEWDIDRCLRTCGDKWARCAWKPAPKATYSVWSPHLSSLRRSLFCNPYCTGSALCWRFSLFSYDCRELWSTFQD